MNTLSAETLHAWLEEGRAVSLVDVRPAAQRAEGAIAGSLHIDAYDALWARDPSALAELALPLDRPVVTICKAGKLASQVAAEQLAARGLEVFSLEGGMQAWSSAGYPTQ
jgi:rhodanese-related sulfurtransferase